MSTLTIKPDFCSPNLSDQLLQVPRIKNHQQPMLQAAVLVSGVVAGKSYTTPPTYDIRIGDRVYTGIPANAVQSRTLGDPQKLTETP